MLRTFESRLRLGVVSVGVALAMMATSAQAQVISPVMSAQRAPLTDAQLDAAMASSIPMENLLTQNPLAGGGSSGGGDSADFGQGGGSVVVAAAVTSQGQPGRMEAGRASELDFYGTDALAGLAAQGADGVAPQNYGIGNLGTIYHYNDYLQVPIPATYYPWRVAGYFLFLAADSQWYHCTASLIQRTIIVTAGHCVHDGSGSSAGWNQDGYFYPAYTRTRPVNQQYYGRCRTVLYATTSGWYNAGTITDGHDVAMALCGRLYGGTITASRNQFPGHYLGWFGFCYLNCTMDYNFLTQIGYPANYYGGNQMTISQHIEETALSGRPDYVYGTGMSGGSSGGPHVQNIGWINDNAFPGYNTARNIIFAVTSWGYVFDTYKIQGASPISGPNNTNNAQGMFNILCQTSRNWFGGWTCQNL